MDKNNSGKVTNQVADLIITFGQSATPHFTSSSSFFPPSNDNSTKATVTEDPQSYYQLSALDLTFYSLLYGLTIIIAVTGNALVIWIVTRGKRVHQSNTNYFIISLAFVDLFIMIFNLPWTFIYTVNGNVWPWGTVWCKLVWSIGTIALSANAFTFTAIMIDRYDAIANPLHKYVEQRRRAILALAVIWLLSFLTGLPTLIGYEAIYDVTDEQVSRMVCRNTSWSEQYEYIHVVILAVVQYAVPLVLTLIAYRFIRLKLCKPKAIGESATAEANAMKMKRKVVSMMMAVVATFTICVFPNNVFVLILYLPIQFVQETLQGTLENGRAILRTFLIVYWLAMSNSMCNPFIYAYWNSNFRLGFKYAFRWLPFVNWDPEIDAKKFFDHRRTLSTVTYHGSGYQQRHSVISNRPSNNDSIKRESVSNQTSSQQQQQPLIGVVSNYSLGYYNNQNPAEDTVFAV